MTGRQWFEAFKVGVAAVGCVGSFLTKNEDGVKFFCPLLLGMLLPGDTVRELTPERIKRALRRKPQG